eukprot:676318-Rhodomonas_salina.1
MGRLGARSTDATSTPEESNPPGTPHLVSDAVWRSCVGRMELGPGLSRRSRMSAVGGVEVEAEEGEEEDASEGKGKAGSGKIWERASCSSTPAVGPMSLSLMYAAVWPCVFARRGNSNARVNDRGRAVPVDGKT